MIYIAFIGFFSSKAESKYGLLVYILLSIILLANFIIFTVLLNFSSLSL